MKRRCVNGPETYNERTILIWLAEMLLAGSCQCQCVLDLGGGMSRLGVWLPVAWRPSGSLRWHLKVRDCADSVYLFQCRWISTSLYHVICNQLYYINNVVAMCSILLCLHYVYMQCEIQAFTCTYITLN